MKNGTPLEFDVETQNDGIFEAGDTSTFNSQKPPEKHSFNFCFPFAYKKTCFSPFNQKNTKNTATKKQGEKCLGRFFLVRCVPFSGPWDLGDACAWRFAIGFSGALVDFWVKPWGVWGGSDLMPPPKTLGGAEEPGVQLWFSWLIPSPWKFGRARYTLHHPKFSEARVSPQKVGYPLFLGYAFVTFSGGKIRHFGAPFFFSCLKKLVTGKGWISYPVSMKGWMVQVVVSW